MAKEYKINQEGYYNYDFIERESLFTNLAARLLFAKDDLLTENLYYHLDFFAWVGNIF